MGARRVAAIDCGTNSIRLLIAEGVAGAPLTDVVREMRIVRLGQDVDRSGLLTAAAIERTRVALVDYAAMIAEHGATAVRMVATSATRDAANRADFSQMVLSVIGIEPEVVTGSAEAQLSFAGAAAGMHDAVAPLLVADIGGGSTELVLGEPRSSGGPDASADERMLHAYSMEIGCVRLTERRLLSDPPTAAEIASALADIDAAIELARPRVPITDAATFVGVAGTVTTMAAIVLGLEHYSPDAIHGSVMTAEQIHELTQRLLNMTLAERAALPVMHPGRADVIGAGALILSALVCASGATAVIASEHDILDGIAASITG
jgi:exopolyphosphatase/guanosine-5'-triphosphate,3'-diphosphate pyrophosphatase